ncbi:calcium-binding protein [Denitratisoma sp. DHT3]|uniref:calcium-binding protein n=1 Tax=Denitratisoma sp. DHT3 TaxID=1981880 RepID=UPI0011A4B640|nr:calcium-binding protein [Denitratisoma sp. DHT3]
MTTEIDLNPTQVQSIYDHNVQVMQTITGAAQSVASNQFVFFAAFDGTNNDQDNALLGEQSTNVWQLFNQVTQSNNLKARYYPGPGTSAALRHSSWLPSAVTQQVINTADLAYTQFAVEASNWVKANPGKPVSIALTSFSRGGASAAIFSQLVYERGVIDPNDNGKVLVPPGQVGICGGVIFDPVTEGVSGNLAFAPNVSNVVVVKALNEYRNFFSFSNYSQPGVTTVGMYGNHGDIGGGYDPNIEGIGAISLEAATRYFQNAGLTVSDVPADRAFDYSVTPENLVNVIKIHSEEYDNYSGTQWNVSYQDGFNYNDVRLSNTNFQDNASAPGTEFTLYDGSKITVTPTGSDTETVEHTWTNADGSVRKEITRYQGLSNPDVSQKRVDKTLLDISADGTTATIDVTVYVENAQIDISLPSGVSTSTLNVQAENGIDPTSIKTAIHTADGQQSSLTKTGNSTDTYYAEEGDTIRDADGKGTVYLNGKQLTLATRHKGETAYHDNQGNTYILTGTTLQINDPLVIEKFSSGDLGLELKEESDPDDPGNPPLKAPFDKAEATLSPIVLDLDGNGIATRGIGEGAYFDYDGNGFAQRTGWVSSGDGLLVRDLNQDGKISTGAELFGNQTRLKDGSLAANGFLALADLDDNRDEKIDLQDAAWQEIKLWQDTNSDGISQAGELKTLEAAGIRSLNTAYVSTPNTDTHGNQHLQQSTYTKTAGSSGQAEDVWFLTNPASTRQDHPLDVPEDIRTLPNVAGMGNVGSLWQVMAKQEAEGSDRLKDLIGQFASEADPLARENLITQIIYAWAGVEDKDPLSRATTKIYNNPIGDARKLYAMEALLGQGYEGTWCWQEKDPNPHGPAAAILLKAFDEFASGIAAQLMQQTQFKELYDAIAYNIAPTTGAVTGDLSGVLPLIARKLAANREQGKAELSAFITNLTYTNKLNELDTLSFQAALASYGEDVVNVANLAWRGMVATWGNDQLTGDGTDETIAGLGGNDVIQGAGGNDHLLGNDGDDRLYGQDGNDTLEGGAGNDLLDGGAGNDTYRFGRGGGQDTIWSQDVTANKHDVLKLGDGIVAGNLTLERNADDLILTIKDSGDRITVAGYFTNDGTAFSRLDVIEFTDGTSWNFTAIRDLLPPIGTEGDDRIRGYGSAEVIAGLGGNDVIEGLGGDDVLDGGAGNDILYGGAGNDIYRFGFGSGQDVINDLDSTFGNVDTIQMLDGVVPDDVVATRDVSNLYLRLNNGTDWLTLQNWFSGNSYQIERVRFADGTEWNAAAMQALSNIPTAYSDYIQATPADDVLDGLGGNDHIYGGAGNDMLSGGIGNDYLSGDTGNDTYLFGRGDGQDTISSYEWNTSKQDVLRFKTGISSADVVVSRQSDNLILKIAGTQDQITVQSYFSNDGAFNAYGLESIQFEDGSPAWDYAAVKAKSLLATGSDDTLYGFGSDDVLEGRGGNDTLYGQGGNDTLSGGVGNDYLGGDAGNDIYLFGRGDGQDTISNYDITQGKQDVLRFKTGIAPADVVVSRQSNNLILKIAGTQDQVMVQNYFSNDGAFNAYGLESIQFEDGSPAWDYAAVKAKSLLATEGDDSLYGFASDDVLDGLGGNDQILGGAGNDTLSGGTGNDHLSGEDGNDSLVGGGGTDNLDGGPGNDIYLFGRDDGQDTISSYDSTQGKQDVLRFKTGISPTDVVVSRQGINLILKVAGAQDQITVHNYFAYDGAFNPYGIESIQFADGTTWNLAAVKARSLLGTEAGDVIYGFDSADVVDALAGDDLVYGNAGNDTLSGGAGNDRLYGGSGEDILDGGAGNDSLQGEVGNDIYLFGSGAGQDSIYDYDTTPGNVDTLRLAAGVLPADVAFKRDLNNLYLSLHTSTDQLTLTNWFSSSTKVERLVFADGTEWTEPDILARMPSATNGDDVLVGTAANDTISGLSGNDVLYGQGGDDVLDGGTGNDFLYGGEGNDTYLFGLGSGWDSVSDTAGSGDMVRMTDGVLPEQVTVDRDSINLYLRMNGGADQLTLSEWMSTDSHKVERIEFGDGTVWDVARLLLRAGVGQGNNIVTGTSADDVLEGLGGNDAIYGLGGNDTLLGGVGSDRLYGGEGNDVLDGGSGDDYLEGGGGSDTYLFGPGSGQDVIVDAVATYGAINKVRLAEGVLPSDVHVKFYGNGILYLGLNHYADRVTLGNTEVEFSDGTRWTQATMRAMANSGSELSDVLFGTEDGDILDGAGGDDLILGNGGNDVLKGGAGNDYLYGGLGNDIYIFGLGFGHDYISDSDSTVGNLDTVHMEAGTTPADVHVSRDQQNLYLDLDHGNDRLTLAGWFANNDSRIERVVFSDGTEWDIAHLQALTSIATTGDDHLMGTSGDDVLAGLAGNDRLEGGDGNDTYQFNAGDGWDLIWEGDDPSMQDMDSLTFGNGITPESVSVLAGVNGRDNLTLLLADGQGRVDIAQYFSGSPLYYGGGYGGGMEAAVLASIEEIKFANGAVWDLAAVKALARTEGTDADESLYGSSKDDTLSSHAGRDWVYGYGGNDTLDGGSGDDRLNGGSGDDIYCFGSGYGQDEVYEYDATAGNVDTVRMAAGVSPFDVRVTRSTEDLYLSLNNGTDRLTLLGWFRGPEFKVEQVQFSDGTIWNEQDLVDALYTSDDQDNTIIGTGEDDTISGRGGADQLYGLDGNDYLKGDDGNDYLNGGLGDDTLDGGSGDDALEGGWGSDVYLFGPGSGTDTVNDIDASGGIDTVRFSDGVSPSDVVVTQDQNNLLLALNGGADRLILSGWFIDDAHKIEQIRFGDGTVWTKIDLVARLLTGDDLGNTLVGTAGDDVISGLGGHDQLSGLDGNDFLDGGTGGDTMIGGLGDDTYVVDSGNDVVTENPNEGIDTVRSSITYTLGTNVENLTLTGIAAISGTGNASDNLLTGNNSANTLTGAGGNDILDGGSGADTMVGGTGDDTYVVDDAGDVVTESSNAGVDTVRSSITYTLGSNVENLILTGATAIDGKGNTLANTLIGNSAANTLNGGTRADTLIGGLGDDLYVVDNVGDVVIESASEGTDTVEASVSYTLGSNVENLTLTGSAKLTGVGNELDNILTGNSGANTLTGGAGNDTLNGGGGTDTLIGGLGDDTYVINSAGDVVTENANEGTDTVQSSIAYTLSANIENLTLTGTRGLAGTGNALDNILIGNSGANTLNGASGADAMAGGAGNDTYVVDDVGDVVTENENEGTDTVQSSISFVLPDNVENLTLLGSSAINGSGNALDNKLTGNNAANYLDGGSGADTMVGDAGDDTYVVDDAGDVVTESSNEGIDTVRSSITYTLDRNVENLILTGEFSINGTGNTLANTLIGNSGANTLNGGTGADTLIGGLGDDLYVVDNVGDVVTEEVDEGTDTVQSSVAYTLGSNVENLTLTGASGLAGTGNALDNILIGNSGANTLTGGAGNDILDGGTGADTLIGGTGDDTYVVERAGDVVTENANEGTDTVQSSIAYTLGANVENLTLTGTRGLAGTGNALDNILIGNSGANTLNGAAGNDTLDGGAGSDTLVGGIGNDIYLFGRGYGADIVSENDATVGNTDLAKFASDIAIDQIWFRHVGNDLEVSVIGSSDKMTILNWYSGSAYHIEKFQTNDGKFLLDTQVENLVQAMAAFSPPAAGQTTLPQNYRDTLAPTLAANWQ